MGDDVKVCLPGLAFTYRELLAARGNTTKHADDTLKGILKVLAQGKIATWTELTEARVLLAVNASRPAASLSTMNHWIRATRGFVRWMHRSGLIPRDPMHGIRLFSERTDIRRGRRPLNRDEQIRLLNAATAGDPIAGIPGSDRAILYETALRTGIRAGELRGLRGFDLTHRLGRWYIRVRATISKNRREAWIPIHSELADRLAERARRRGRSTPLFDLPHRCHVVKMLRNDLRRAGIEYRTAEGSADFHALRHTFLSDLTQRCDDIKAVQILARHSTPTLTFALYAHRTATSIATAIDQLQPLRS